MQHEIKTIANLLDSHGNIAEPGYAKKLLSIYNNPKDSLFSKLRTKEWDYYLIINDHFALALTLADNGYMGLDSISFLDFDNKWEITKSPMQFMTLGKKNFPPSSVTGDIEYGDKNYHISFKNNTTERHLTGFMNKFKDDISISFDITLSDIPEESMVIATPFDKDRHFYYNQKINCMSANGKVEMGDKCYTFNKENSSAVLDWGRGIWTYSNTWYWSSLNTRINGVSFGWNLGYGFGNTSAATENMFFYDGKAFKLEDCDFGLPEIKKDSDFYKDWHFTGSNEAIDVIFKPVLDRTACTDVKIIKSDQHQVFGRFYGKCKLTDELTITLDGQLGFAEKVTNKW